MTILPSLTCILAVIINIIIVTFGRGEYSSLFTYDQYQVIKNKRVRREIRDVTFEEWERVAEAMNIMKDTPTHAGRSLYGEDFVNYDDLVCRHARANFHTGFDAAHVGPHFGPWHRAFGLQFENSLIAIDPEIEASVYWDWRRDLTEGNSAVFNGDYLGDYTTINDANGDYTVKNGKFAFWPIHENPSEYGCGDSLQNAFGLLRQRDNIEGTPYVTRYGGTVCGQLGLLPAGNPTVYQQCLDETDYTQFFYCSNFGVHDLAHAVVGGQRLAYQSQTSMPFPVCVGWIALSHTAWGVTQPPPESNNVRKWGQQNGCFECPAPNTCTYQPGFENEFDLYQCAQCNLTNGNPVCHIENSNAGETGIDITIIGEREHQQILGDFADGSTSPNDPIFFLHHGNVDRYHYEWQLKNYEQAPYYNYPTEGFVEGVHLNDIMSPEVPFINICKGIEYAPDQPLTFKDIWDCTDVLEAPYVYDTVLDLINPEPETCDDQCDAFGVSARVIEPNHPNEVCIRYKVSRLLSDGLCIDPMERIVLGLCDADIGTIKQKDLYAVVRGGRILPNGVPNRDGLLGENEDDEGDDDGEFRGGIRVNIAVDDEMSFELCFDDIFMEPATFSNSIRFERGILSNGDPNRFNCGEQYLQGLPCIDHTKLM